MENETGKLSFDRLFLLSGIYALFYTVCLYKNKMGITFPVFVLGTAGLFQYYLRLTGRTLKKGSALYLGGILLLGLNVCLTCNEIVILFDKGFIFLLFFMLFLHNLYDDSAWDVSKYALSLCACVLSTVKFLPRPVKDLGEYLRSRNSVSAKNSGATAEATSEVVLPEAVPPAQGISSDKTTSEVTSQAVVNAAGHVNSAALYVLIGLGISLPLLAVILPLLLSSDVIFLDFFESMFDFGIEIDPGAVLFMMLVVFVMCYGLLCRFEQPMKFAAAPVTDKRRYSPVIAITVNVVLLCVYLVYCGIQVIYLFLPRMPFARFAAGVLVSLWMIFAYAKPDYQIAAYNIQYHDDDSYIMQLSFDAVPAIEKYDKSGKLLSNYFDYGYYPYHESIWTGGALQGKKKSLRKWNYSLQKTYKIYDKYNAEQKSEM